MQVMVIMCGIPGSGKSTFSASIVQSMEPEYRAKWVILNQDVLESRKRVEEEAHRHLQLGYSVIIDRCNFDVAQRRHWIKLADKYQVDEVLCITMPAALDVALCARRATDRGNDGIHAPDTNWLSVCSSMRAQYRAPSLSEGFSGMFCCGSERDMDQIRNAIANVAHQQPPQGDRLIAGTPLAV